MASYGVPKSYVLGWSADAPGSLTLLPVPYECTAKPCLLGGRGQKRWHASAAGSVLRRPTERVRT
jgi:hypothetical protein